MRLIYLVSVSIHVVAAMTWIGGMVLFAATLMPTLRALGDSTRQQVLAAFGPRFRMLSRVCLAALIPTGAINLWARGVRVDDLFSPDWRASGFGHLVIVKLTLVVLAVLMMLLHERPAMHAHARWLGRVTLLIGLAIVAVATVLVREY